MIIVLVMGMRVREPNLGFCISFPPVIGMLIDVSLNNRLKLQERIYHSNLETLDNN